MKRSEMIELIREAAIKGGLYSFEYEDLSEVVFADKILKAIEKAGMFPPIKIDWDYNANNGYGEITIKNDITGWEPE